MLANFIKTSVFDRLNDFLKFIEATIVFKNGHKSRTTNFIHYNEIFIILEIGLYSQYF